MKKNTAHKNILATILFLITFLFYSFAQGVDTEMIQSYNSAKAEILAKGLSNCLADESFKNKLEPYSDYIELYYIYITYNDQIKKAENEKGDSYFCKCSTYRQRKQLELIGEKLEYLTSRKFMLFKMPQNSRKLVKSINIHHSNDVFLPFVNEDRNMTGEARLEFTTDYLNLRIFDFFWKRSILTYQSVFIGGEAYTPAVLYEVEDVENFSGQLLKKDEQTGKLDSSSLEQVKGYLRNIHKDDRPFGSYYYFGRSQYRMHRKGNWRLKSDIRFGMIGRTAPAAIQAFIHRDIFTPSKKVLLWENQIANGGRFSFNFDYQLDISARNKFESSRLSKLFLCNYLNVGSRLTSIGTGVGWSNKKFIETNLNGDLLNKRIVGNRNANSKARFQSNKKNHLLLEFRTYFKYIIHDSLLEGIGVIKPFKIDEFDNDVTSSYVLLRSQSEIVPVVLFAEAKLAYRLPYASLNLSYVFFTKEFNKLEAKPIYGYGRLGINYYIN